MGVHVDEAGGEDQPVDGDRAVGLELLRAVGDADDAVAFDEHVAAHGVGAEAIDEDAAGKQRGLCSHSVGIRIVSPVRALS